MTITSAVPVLRVSNYAKARAFWRDQLGFAVAEEGGDPPRFGIFIRDGQRVFLDGWHGPDAPGHQGWRVYFHTPDVDALAEWAVAQGIVLAKPLHDTPYGMREFEIVDPDGNRLCFGQPLDGA
ncbi:glyoxalase superfamily protein [Amaricoccus macauensis]|uniref:glyoxalase superfamily protein n=1 Tax=Amaricoccus macauensis TaxID=57001 RepID=UPI003C7DA918